MNFGKINIFVIFCDYNTFLLCLHNVGKINGDIKNPKIKNPTITIPTIKMPSSSNPDRLKF